MELEQKVRDMFKGVSGGFDTARVAYFCACMCVIFLPPIFQGWAIAVGQQWRPLEFLPAWGGCITAVVYGGAQAIKAKDKGVAEASNTLGLSAPVTSGGQN